MKPIFMFALSSLTLVWSQSNIGGSAPVTFVDGGTACNGSARIVDLYADVTGLSGDGGAAGINAFIMALDFSLGYVSELLFPGEGPVPFTIVATDPVLAFGAPTVVGYAADTDAPNTQYHLVRLWVKGPPGGFTVSLDGLASGLGSRVAAGFGPDNIAVTAPPTANFQIDAFFNLPYYDGLASWLLLNPDYDLVAPTGEVEVRDLVMLVNCASSN